MQIRRLKDLCKDIVSGGTPSTKEAAFWGGNIPWITSADINENFEVEPKKFITKKAKSKILPANNILIVTRVGLGKIASNKYPIAFSQDIQGLIIKEGQHIPYLLHALSVQVKKFKDIGRGATIKGVTRDDLETIEIPLPDLQTQKQIASILEDADRARQHRKAANDLTKQFLQSSFLHLFGDPVMNEKKWEVVKIRDIAIEVKYGTSKPAQTHGTYPYLRMNNITYEGRWNFSDLKFISLEENEKEKYLLKRGDLVFNRTNSKELVGKTAVYNYDEEMAIAGYLIRVRLNDKAVPEYISGYLNSSFGKELLKAMCKNIIGMANINAQELQNISLPLPPLSLQQHFASLVADAEILRQKQQQSERELEHLFQALLQKYFSSEASTVNEMKETLSQAAEPKMHYAAQESD